MTTPELKPDLWICERITVPSKHEGDTGYYQYRPISAFTVTDQMVDDLTDILKDSDRLTHEQLKAALEAAINGGE